MVGALQSFYCAHEFNNVREYIIRDHGFWAFYLISLLCLLHYFSKPKRVTALAFSGSLLLATLFRIEGAIFLLVLPWLAWCHFNLPLRQRLKHFVLLSLPLIVAGVAILAWLAFHPQQTLAHLGRVQELLTQFQHGIGLMGERFQATKNGLATAVLPLDSIHQCRSSLNRYVDSVVCHHGDG